MARKKKTPDDAASATQAAANTSFAQAIAEAVSGMIYISESEAPLDLQDWPEVKDLASLQARIGDQFKIAPEAQTVVPADDFLSAIQQTADPADPVMVDYASRFGKLFTLLKAHASTLTVIRAGGQPIHIFIAAFGDPGPVVIHTTSVET